MYENPSPADGRGRPRRVALAATCLVDQFFPEVGLAAARLLRRAGVRVEVPRAQTCCGQPFFNSGFRPQAERLARHTVRVFSRYDAVVLPSGSCAAMIRSFPELLPDDPQAHGLAEKTYELSEFLVRRARWQPRPNGEAPAVSYHDSCHMCRLLGLREEPRALLRAAGCVLHEMPEPDRCCGFGGLFSLRLPEVAEAMGREKLAQARGTEGTLVTADPGCLLHLRSLNARDVVHLACLLEELSR